MLPQERRNSLTQQKPATGLDFEALQRAAGQSDTRAIAEYSRGVCDNGTEHRAGNELQIVFVKYSGRTV